MKILHIVPTYLPAYRYGGPIYSVHELNKWLVKNRAEVTVYTTSVDGPDDLKVPEGVPVDRDGVKVYYFKSRFLRSWYYSRDLKKAIANNIQNFDLIHITSVFLSASYWGARYAKKASKPYIISPRGSLIPELIAKKSSLKKNLYIKLIEKNNLADAAAIHFTTELEKDEYLNLGLPIKKDIIIPNGVEVSIPPEIEEKNNESSLRNKLKVPPEAKVVLSLGRLNWKKGFDTLMPAFSRVVEKDPKAFLVIAGTDADEPGYKQKIVEMIKDENLKNVIFAGDLRGEEKVAAYGTATAFVMPSSSENFGISAIESMASGTAVVVTKGVGIYPDIQRMGAGIVVEKNPKEISDAILKIIESPSLAEKLEENGKRLVREKYSWPKISEKWMEEYQKLIKPLVG